MIYVPSFVFAKNNLNSVLTLSKKYTKHQCYLLLLLRKPSEKQKKKVTKYKKGQSQL